MTTGTRTVASGREQQEFEVVLRAGAVLLAERPFAEVSLADVSAATGIPRERLIAFFVDTRALGSAILDHERAAMHRMQENAPALPDAPLVELRAAFAAVGRLLAEDVVVRAGVKLAAEARARFPERRLDPFRTWQGFVDARLERAQRLGQVRAGTDLGTVSRLIVAGGMGTKDFLAMRGDWTESEMRFDEMISTIIGLISVTSS